MSRIRSSLVCVVCLAVLAPASVEAAWYGSGRFRAVEIRFDTPGVVAVVQAYLGEGTHVIVDPDDPAQDYEISFVCAQVYTPGGRDQHCGDGIVEIDWPLLENARVEATIGSIAIDLTITERGALRFDPLAETGLPPFAHVGVSGFRPGSAGGSITSGVGSVSGETSGVGLYELTSAYGTF